MTERGPTFSRTRCTASIFFINIVLEVTAVTGIVCGPTFQRLFELSTTELGIALGALDLGMLLSAPLAGHFTYRLGSHTSLLSGLAIIFSGVVVIMAAPSYGVLVLGLACVGASAGLIGNANATFLADLFPGRLRHVMALASALWFASSALSAPLVGRWLQLARQHELGRWSYRCVYLLQGGLVVVAILLAVVLLKTLGRTLVAEMRQREDQAAHSQPVTAATGKAWLWIPALAFCHGIMVIVMLAWLNPMAQEKFRADEFHGALMLAALASGLAGGRLVLAFVSLRWDERTILAASALIGGSFFALALFADNYIVTAGAVLVAGLVACATFPCILAITGNLFPRTKSKVYGYMHASIALAGFVGPPTVGLLADHGVDLWTAMVVSPLAAALLAALAITWKIRSAA